MFELGEDLLDGIEIRAVGRQEEQLGAGRANSSADGLALMAAEIIHDDDVPWGEGRHEKLFDIGGEAHAVDRAVEDAGRVDAVTAQGGKKGERAPLAMRRFGDQLLSAWSPASQRGHVGFGPCLVDEDEALGFQPALVLPPLPPAPGDGWTILLTGE